MAFWLSSSLLAFLRTFALAFVSPVVMPRVSDTRWHSRLLGSPLGVARAGLENGAFLVLFWCDLRAPFLENARRTAIREGSKMSRKTVSNPNQALLRRQKGGLAEFGRL